MNRTHAAVLAVFFLAGASTWAAELGPSRTPCSCGAGLAGCVVAVRPDGSCLATFFGRSGEGTKGLVISAHFDAISAGEFARLLSAQEGAKLVYSPADPAQVLSIHVNQVALDDVLRFLTECGGAVGTAGDDDRLTLSAKGIRASALSAVVTRLTGGRLAFNPTNPDEILTLEIKDVSASALRLVLGRFGEADLIAQSKR